MAARGQQAGTSPQTDFADSFHGKGGCLNGFNPQQCLQPIYIAADCRIGSKADDGDL